MIVENITPYNADAGYEIYRCTAKIKGKIYQAKGYTFIHAIEECILLINVTI